MLTRDSQKSLSYGQQALALASRLRQEKSEVRALLAMAYAQAFLDKTEEALKLSNQALKKARQLADKSLIMRSYSCLAQGYIIKGAFQQAIDNARIAYRFARQTGNLWEQKNCLTHISECQYRLGEYIPALTTGLQGLRLAEQVKDTSQLATSMAQISAIYSELRDTAKMISYAEKAVKLADKISQPNVLGNGLSALAVAYFWKGRLLESLQLYERLAKEVDVTPSNQSINWGNIAEIYRMQKRYDLAKTAAHRAFRLARKVNSVLAQSWAVTNLAATYQAMGRLDSATYYAQLGLRHSESLGEKTLRPTLYQTLADVYAQRKDFTRAYHYQSQAIAYKDSLNNDEKTRQAAAIQLNFELSKKQNEIALLTKDKQLQVQEARRQRLLFYGSLVVLALIGGLVFILLRSNRQQRQANTLLSRQKQEIDQQARQVIAQRDELQTSYRNVEQLGQIGRQITTHLTAQPIIATTYANVNHLMDAAVFGIGLYNADQDELEFPATYERGEPLPPYTNPLTDENRLDVWCFTRQEELVIGNLQAEYTHYIAQLQEPKAGAHAQSLIYLPLKVKEKCLGVITVQSFQQEAYSAYHLYMLRNLAIYVAIALENADAYGRLNQTLAELKATQAQLIQQEKLASLGELTKGIVDRILNPVNYINNFAQASVSVLEEVAELLQQHQNDLAREIRQELEEALEMVRQSLDKIQYHGASTARIMQDMQKLLKPKSTEFSVLSVNKLVEQKIKESLQKTEETLKPFRPIELAFELDPRPMLSKVLPHELSQVLTSLLENACYALTEKSKKVPAFEPHIWVKTYREADQVRIQLRDNGKGIPVQELKQVFTPFFTTKPTSKGTGLGLYISKDLIEYHQGRLVIESQEGEFTQVTIVLPVATESDLGSLS